jgi:glycosyltransferase involved in cell wall biosynthesis
MKNSINREGIYFDARWINSGGIGRFCQEVMQSKLINSFRMLNGDVSDALSLMDIFRISLITLNGGIFITPGYNSPLFGNDKAIITIHDLMHLKYTEYRTLKNIVYYQFLVKRVVRRAPVVFTGSHFTKSEISQWAGINSDKIIVLNYGVDHQIFNVHVVPFIHSRPYFLYIGNFKPHKNLTRLIRAFFYSGLYQHCDLLLSCSTTSNLSALVDELGLKDQVKFLNGIDEHLLPGYYKGALATVVVSLYEGFCLPILESMAVGTPVLTSNVTAMPETAGEAALFADPYSENHIAAQLTKLYQCPELRKKLSSAGLKRAKSFSWDHSRAVLDKTLFKIMGI